YQLKVMNKDTQNNWVEERKYMCKFCGFCPTNRSTWCDKGCGSDYNEMIDVTDVYNQALLETEQRAYERCLKLINEITLDIREPVQISNRGTFEHIDGDLLRQKFEQAITNEMKGV